MRSSLRLLQVSKYSRNYWHKPLSFCHSFSLFASPLSLSLPDLLAVQTVLLYLCVAVWKVLSWYTIPPRKAPPVSPYLCVRHHLRETEGGWDGERDREIEVERKRSWQGEGESERGRKLEGEQRDLEDREREMGKGELEISKMIFFLIYRFDLRRKCFAWKK